MCVDMKCGAQWSEGNEGNVAGEEWGFSWMAFIGREGGEVAGRGRAMLAVGGAL
jgi:hypothetical protein